LDYTITPDSKMLVLFRESGLEFYDMQTGKKTFDIKHNEERCEFC